MLFRSDGGRTRLAVDQAKLSDHRPWRQEGHDALFTSRRRNDGLEEARFQPVAGIGKIAAAEKCLAICEGNVGRTLQNELCEARLIACRHKFALKEGSGASNEENSHHAD